mmetsp:Transcript_18254/g.33288  ORF Transcript_18254/g.33288 Transcript_18254/m.33288 type:complete len:390 (+) Transcript_18254:80-1249(+)
MNPSLLYRRGIQPARLFLPAAIAIDLNPASLAFIAPGGSCRHFQLAPSLLLATKNSLPRYFPIRSCPNSSILSLSRSTSDSPSTHGSSAVRSIKPLPLPTESKFQLLSFYQFLPISQPDKFRDTLFERLKTISGLRGTVYIAKEGINAQFAVPTGESLDNLLQVFGRKEGGCLPFDIFEKNPPNMGNVVDSDTPTFGRLVVRTRDYILRDGINLNDEEGGDSSLDWSDAGIELDPSEWDEQLRKPKHRQLLDCRNKYESDRGSFVSAKPLNTQTFSDTWSVLDSQMKSQYLDPSEPVYIFCTGGIRCVKVGAYLRQHLGFDDVRSLRHGIIGYERWNGDDGLGIAESENDGGCSSNDDANNNQKERETLWVGENFPFDKRCVDTSDNKS